MSIHQFSTPSSSHSELWLAAPAAIGSGNNLVTLCTCIVIYTLISKSNQGLFNLSAHPSWFLLLSFNLFSKPNLLFFLLTAINRYLNHTEEDPMKYATVKWRNMISCLLSYSFHSSPKTTCFLYGITVNINTDWVNMTSGGSIGFLTPFAASCGHTAHMMMTYFLEQQKQVCPLTLRNSDAALLIWTRLSAITDPGRQICTCCIYF